MALRLFLTGIVIGNTAGLYKCLTDRAELLDRFPVLTPSLLNALTLVPALGIVGAGLLWFRWRLGLLLLVALGVVAIAADLWMGMPVLHLLTVLALTLALVTVTWAWRRELALR